MFDACYVATDDPRIEQAVLSFGGRVVMTSSEHPSGTDRCREALVEVERETGTAFDVVVNIQGDEPFVSREQLELIQQCFEDSGTDIATLVKPFGPQEDVFNPNSPKVVVSAQGYALYFSRSVIPYRRGVEPQQWQEGFKYLKHIGMYAYRTGVLHRITDLPRGVLEQCESLEQLRWLENGFKVKVAETLSESLAIDTPQDLEAAPGVYGPEWRLVIFSGPGIWEIGKNGIFVKSYRSSAVRPNCTV